MATQSSISINYTTTAGKKGQKAITDVNPNAANATLKTFAGMVNALTTNTYIGTSRVDKTPLKSASTLLQPVFSIVDFCEQYQNTPAAEIPTTFSYAQVHEWAVSQLYFIYVGFDYAHDGQQFWSDHHQNIFCQIATCINLSIKQKPKMNPKNKFRKDFKSQARRRQVIFIRGVIRVNRKICQILPIVIEYIGNFL